MAIVILLILVPLQCAAQFIESTGSLAAPPPAPGPAASGPAPHPPPGGAHPRLKLPGYPHPMPRFYPAQDTKQKMQSQKKQIHLSTLSHFRRMAIVSNKTPCQLHPLPYAPSSLKPYPSCQHPEKRKKKKKFPAEEANV
jgi:hypothetical protein